MVTWFSVCSTFAVMLSSVMTAGKQETLCAQIHGPTEPLVLRISLHMDPGRTLVLQEAVKQDFYRCAKFQV